MKNSIKGLITQLVFIRTLTKLGSYNRFKEALDFLTWSLRANPQTEINHSLFLEAGVGYWAIYALLQLSQKDMETEPEEKKDCYFLNLMGVQSIHNLNSKSPDCQKRIIKFERRCK